MQDPSLAWRFREEGGKAIVELSGAFTESGDFGALLAKLPAEFVFDLSGVSRINSQGVRQWVGFLNSVRQAGKRFALERCSPAVVAQLNMVSTFDGGGQVRSVLAPFLCTECNIEHA